ncbi:Hypothetical predicted protein [Pelobates cultripes]|uniref:Uncharacterized protein n=1 Tax=Pelobates cultripes TaxID=61616 RepID=A0AAD1W810_PELCU|nr:Hypothetical predicted protein [Pelobates cultripes]
MADTTCELTPRDPKPSILEKIDCLQTFDLGSPVALEAPVEIQKAPTLPQSTLQSASIPHDGGTRKMVSNSTTSNRRKPHYQLRKRLVGRHPARRCRGVLSPTIQASVLSCMKRPP